MSPPDILFLLKGKIAITVLEKMMDRYSYSTFLPEDDRNLLFQFQQEAFFSELAQLHPTLIDEIVDIHLTLDEYGVGDGRLYMTKRGFSILNFNPKLWRAINSRAYLRLGLSQISIYEQDGKLLKSYSITMKS